MQIHRRTTGKKSLSLVILFITSLLLSPALVHAAEKKPSKKPAAKQTRAKPAASETKAELKETLKVDEGTAQAAFETFVQEWMTKLAEAEEYQRTQRVKVTLTPDGYSAEYVGYLPERSIQVKKTEYEDTPFVGTLTYYERTLRCTGKTKEQALQGPFEQVGTSPVREIFRFTKGKWVY
jgi:hypothetical protein